MATMSVNGVGTGRPKRSSPAKRSPNGRGARDTTAAAAVAALGATRGRQRSPTTANRNGNGSDSKSGTNSVSDGGRHAVLRPKPLTTMDYAFIGSNIFSDDERKVLLTMTAANVEVSLGGTGKGVAYTINARYVAAPSPSTQPFKRTISWTCTSCTLENKATSERCEVCSAPAPSPSLPSTTTSVAVAPAVPVSSDDQKQQSMNDSKRAEPSVDIPLVVATPVTTGSTTSKPANGIGAGSGARTALCLHGFGNACTWATWTKMILPLHRAGFQVILIDLPGFGESSGRDIQTIGWFATLFLSLWDLNDNADHFRFLQ
jgi:hypothetical protein